MTLILHNIFMIWYEMLVTQILKFSDQNFVWFWSHQGHIMDNVDGVRCLMMHHDIVESYDNNFAWHINHMIWYIINTNLKFSDQNFVSFHFQYLMMKIFWWCIIILLRDMTIILNDILISSYEILLSENHIRYCFM